MPRRLRRLARVIGDKIGELERQGADTSDESVAAALGLTIEDYKHKLEQIVHVPVGALEIDEDTMMPSGEESSPEQQANHRRALARVRAALERTEKRDLLVLSLYYNDELTYSEIGEVLGGVTRSRVCQLHGRAIARLRASIHGAPGEEEAA
jgi:RNA polymerase sigma factor for flagellar operon FliA